MKHIDEGTIHAWLDGALSDSEAREVSQHTATCAQCGALVAEARGFIAGASRILTSLDDVPAGVAPKRVPVAGHSSPRRFWQAAPWVTGIAAALMLAIGIKEWRDRPSAKATFAPVNATMDSLRMDAAPTSAPRAPQPAVTIQLRAPAAEASGAGAAGAGTTKGPERANAAVAAATAGDSARAQAELQKKDLAADAMPLGETSSMRARRDERLLAGCYRFPEQLTFEKVEVASAKVPTREPATAAAAAAAERRLAAPAAQGAVAPAIPAVPAIVRLDTTMTSIGRVIRSPETGEAIGTWRAVEGDSIRVLVQMGRSRTIPASYRVTCPQAEGRP